MREAAAKARDDSESEDSDSEHNNKIEKLHPKRVFVNTKKLVKDN